MSATSALLAGRRAAEALMTDRCRITRPSGDVDPLTGQPVNPALVYEGRCKVQTYEPHESLPEAGGAQWVVQRYGLHIPAAAPQVRVDDEALILSSALYPQMVGTKRRIAALLKKTWATAQRLGLEEVVR